MSISLLQHQSIGDIPPTPFMSSLSDSATPTTHALLYSVARSLGHPVGYLQEQQGKIIHDIVPIKKTETAQMSTSSVVTLDLHTESCFHPYLPDYVLLLCLRDDPSAATTYADLEDIIPDLGIDCLDILTKPWFLTSVDESFRTNGEPDQPRNIPILTKQKNNTYRLRYDQAVMVGTKKEAVWALSVLNNAINKHIKEVILKTGDLLIIDNSTTIHGRKPFKARYDGTDRWLQRLLVRKNVENLPHIHCAKTGHLIITKYTE